MQLSSACPCGVHLDKRPLVHPPLHPHDRVLSPPLSSVPSCHSSLHLSPHRFLPHRIYPLFTSLLVSPFVRSWDFGLPCAFSLGYFLWDMAEVTRHYHLNGPMYIVHAIMCIAAYASGAIVGHLLLTSFPPPHLLSRVSLLSSTSVSTCSLRSPLFS